jgi:uncharacterized protein
MRAFKINIIGLSNKVHHFDFQIDDNFFRHYGQGSGLVTEGKLEAQVELDKRETMLETRFLINGTVKLICDRSLDPFEYPMKINKKVIFKYGDADEELSDEIIMINREADSLELGQYMYEFINLEIPMKKLHPRYQDEPDTDDSEGKIIYSSGSTSADSESDEDIDPRWEKLKKLK